jgi:hypothetical protein
VTVSETATPAVRNYQVTGGTLQQNVFVTGSDGKLYLDDWNGVSWTWRGLGAPGAGVTVYAIPVALVNDKVAGSTLHQHVFVVGSTSIPGEEDLYLDDWDSVHWDWTDQGSPSATAARPRTTPELTEAKFSDGGPRAWFAVIRRQGFGEKRYGNNVDQGLVFRDRDRLPGHARFQHAGRSAADERDLSVRESRRRV